MEITALLVLGWYAWTTHKQWNAMIRQNDIAEQQFHASHRPWIEPHISIAEPLTFYPDYAEIALTITAKNGGTSPAIRSLPILSLVIIGVQSEDNPVLKQQNIRCRPESVKSQLEAQIPAGSSGRLLLPNSEVTYPTWGVRSHKSNWRLSPEGEAFAYVTGCIAYMDDLGSSHATLFTLLLATSAFKPSGVISGRWGLAPYGQGAY